KTRKLMPAPARTRQAETRPLAPLRTAAIQHSPRSGSAAPLAQKPRACRRKILNIGLPHLLHPQQGLPNETCTLGGNLASILAILLPLRPSGSIRRADGSRIRLRLRGTPQADA